MSRDDPEAKIITLLRLVKWDAERTSTKAGVKTKIHDSCSNDLNGPNPPSPIGGINKLRDPNHARV